MAIKILSHHKIIYVLYIQPGNPHGILDQDFFSYENLRPAERRKKLSALVMTFMFLYRLTILQL
jgi:hypothetical protein